MALPTSIPSNRAAISGSRSRAADPERFDAGPLDEVEHLPRRSARGRCRRAWRRAGGCHGASARWPRGRSGCGRRRRSAPARCRCRSLVKYQACRRARLAEPAMIGPWSAPPSSPPAGSSPWIPTSPTPRPWRFGTGGSSLSAPPGPRRRGRRHLRRRRLVPGLIDRHLHPILRGDHPDHRGDRDRGLGAAGADVPRRPLTRGVPGAPGRGRAGTATRGGCSPGATTRCGTDRWTGLRWTR